MSDSADTPLWRAEAAAAAIGGRAEGGWAGVGGVAIDTREMAAGDLFVALKGDNRDGHAFVADALAKGAGAALVDHRPDGVPSEAPLLVAPSDTLTALEGLGRAARARAGALRAIGVTGSVGKTSTKEMLREICAAQNDGPTHAATRSFNNHWGVPLTLARTPEEARWGVYEIGMNAPGEIAPLAKLARPNAALITAVAAVHLEAFESVAGIADEKASIFQGLEPGGVAVVPRDTPHFERLADHAAAAGAAKIHSFGTHEAADARLLDVVVGEAETMVQAELWGEPAMFKIGAPGKHFAMNALGALVTLAALGGDVAKATLALRAWRAVDGRGVRRLVPGPEGAFLLVDESYNANPASLRAAIETFATVPPPAPAGRRIAFLTDMLELGPSGPELHAALAAAPGVEALDQVHTAGPLMRALHDALPPETRGTHAPDAASLAERAPRMVHAGDAVMVKGSLGSKARRIAEALDRLG